MESYLSKCTKTEGFSLIQIQNLVWLGFTMLVMIASKLYCTVYMKLHNMGGGDNSSTLPKIKSCMVCIVVITLMVLLTVISATSKLTIIRLYTAIPVFHVAVFVLKEHEFMCPLFAGFFKACMFCRPKSRVQPEDLSLSDGGIFMGPSVIPVTGNSLQLQTLN